MTLFVPLKRVVAWNRGSVIGAYCTRPKPMDMRATSASVRVISGSGMYFVLLSAFLNGNVS